MFEKKKTRVRNRKEPQRGTVEDREKRRERERAIYGRKAFTGHIFAVNGVEVVIFALLVPSSSGANISASPLITGFQVQ